MVMESMKLRFKTFENTSKKVFMIYLTVTQFSGKASFFLDFKFN